MVSRYWAASVTVSIAHSWEAMLREANYNSPLPPATHRDDVSASRLHRVPAAGPPEPVK